MLCLSYEDHSSKKNRKQFKSKTEQKKLEQTIQLIAKLKKSDRQQHKI